MPNRIQQLEALGQSVWLDFIRRDDLVSGQFDGYVRGGVLGVTSNPTIFHQAITQGAAYDAALERGVASGQSAEALFEAIAIEDIQTACDRLKRVFDRTGGRDGRVSIEVSPKLAYDTTGTIAEARRLHAAVARPNVMVKIPATREGLPAITECLADGICINITLIFSLARYREVMDAYLAALERRTSRGLAIDSIVSVASFFVSRVDTKVDKAIDQALAAQPAGAPERAALDAFRGKAAIANARVAYAAFRETFEGARFGGLAAKGARVQRPLWASTSTKNPAYRDTMYVDELIGADTVNTMPPQTIEAFNDHGTVESRIERDLDAARALFERLPKFGIPVDRLIADLEPEGVAAFEKSYDALIEAIASKRAAIRAR